MDRIRVFLALDLPDEPRKEISRAFMPLIKKYPSIKWVPEENYHITLVFLGEVPPQFIESIEKPLERVAGKYRPFTLALDGWGTFPPGKNLFNVLWVGVEHDDSLIQFQRELSRITGVFERRTYKPHITVARNGRPRVSISESVRIEPVKFVIREVTLFRSILRREGARYQVIRRFPFKGVN